MPFFTLPDRGSFRLLPNGAKPLPATLMPTPCGESKADGPEHFASQPTCHFFDLLSRHCFGAVLTRYRRRGAIDCGDRPTEYAANRTTGRSEADDGADRPHRAHLAVHGAVPHSDLSSPELNCLRLLFSVMPFPIAFFHTLIFHVLSCVTLLLAVLLCPVLSSLDCGTLCCHCASLPLPILPCPPPACAAEIS